MKKAVISILSSGLVILTAWLAITTLSGQAMSTDLSQVGQGRPAIVLAFENYAPTSMDAMDQLNRIRSDYEPEVKFLVADLGTPEGRAFSSRISLSPGHAVLLDGSGTPVRSWFFSGRQWARDLDDDLRKISGDSALNHVD